LSLLNHRCDLHANSIPQGETIDSETKLPFGSYEVCSTIGEIKPKEEITTFYGDTDTAAILPCIDCVEDSDSANNTDNDPD